MLCSFKSELVNIAFQPTFTIFFLFNLLDKAKQIRLGAFEHESQFFPTTQIVTIQGFEVVPGSLLCVFIFKGP